MGIMDSIKGTRKLSYNHWRYRLLHWCFNIQNPPTDLNRTELPKFLYTHYCPLFHLTNLIAIFSPIILFIKIACVIVGATIAGIKAMPWNRLFDFISNLMDKLRYSRDEKEQPADIDQDQQNAIDKQKRKSLFMASITDTELLDSISQYKEIISLLSAKELSQEETKKIFDENISTFFESFWLRIRYRFCTTPSAKEECQVLFNEYMTKIILAQIAAKKRKESLRNTMIFWTNFSRVFIKWSLNVFYVALSLGVIYSLYVVAVPAWEQFCYVVSSIYYGVTSTNFLSLLLNMVIGVTIVSVAVGSILLLAKIGFLERFVDGLFRGFTLLAPPFYLIGKFLDWIFGGIRSVVEFCEMFYEENCPPIVIVNPEEELIDKVANGESVQ